MESDPKHEAELARLRDLGAWMREVGVFELTLGDGTVIRMSPRAPVPSAPAKTAAERDEARELRKEDAEAEAMSDEEREHYRFWRRVTRSSGTEIPPFRKREPRALT